MVNRKIEVDGSFAIYLEYKNFYSPDIYIDKPEVLAIETNNDFRAWLTADNYLVIQAGDMIAGFKKLFSDTDIYTLEIKYYPDKIQFFNGSEIWEINHTNGPASMVSIKQLNNNIFHIERARIYPSEPVSDIIDPEGYYDLT